VETQTWNEQIQAEFAEVLEKVHVLFRTAKRHDMLGILTATKRAAVAELLVVCEQLFRVLLEKEYSKARRLLEMHREVLLPLSEVEENSQGSMLNGKQEEGQKRDSRTGSAGTIEQVEPPA
jgi:hypothetical protein